MTAANAGKAAVLATLVWTACGPVGFVPGTRLTGEPVPAPGAFAFLDEHVVIQLEARGPLLPRVVNLGQVTVGGRLYVSGDAGAGWVRRVARRPDVRVRIGASVYRLRAVVVRDPQESERVFQAWLAKYGDRLTRLLGRPPRPGDLSSIYRLEPAPSPGAGVSGAPSGR